MSGDILFAKFDEALVTLVAEILPIAVAPSTRVDVAVAGVVICLKRMISLFFDVFAHC